MNAKASEPEKQDKSKSLAKARLFLLYLGRLINIMLPKENRLTRMKDYAILFEAGQYLPQKNFSLKYWRLEPDKYPRRKYSIKDLRIGFLVSKKIDKRAVVRNRLKRQMREVVRLLLQEKKVVGGYHLAFIAQAGSAKLEYTDIEKQMVAL